MEGDLYEGQVWVGPGRNNLVEIAKVGSDKFPGFMVYSALGNRLSDRGSQGQTKQWLVTRGYRPQSEVVGRGVARV